MKHRLILLTLFVGTVAVLSFGTAAAQSLADDAPRGNWDQSSSTGEIILDNESYYTVFPGERDIDAWRNVDGDDVTGAFLERSTGGDILDLETSIPRDQRTGRYASPDGSLTARVLTPRVTRLETYNRNGARLSSGAELPSSDKILVRAEWNFAQAEDVRLEIRDTDGTRVTREYLSTDVTARQEELLPEEFETGFLNRQEQGLGSTGFTEAYWLIDPNPMRGTHDITVEGVEDLSFGDASRSVRLSVGDRTAPSLTLDRSTASRGETVDFSVGAEAGTYRAVGIPVSDLRDGADPDRVFRFVGDTVEIGSTDSYAYGIVEITSRATGVGAIDTSRLDTGSVSVRLFREGSTVSEARDSLEQNDVVRRSLTVERGQLSLNIAGGTYVTGQRVDVSGTATPGVDRVAVYVRDRDDWELLPLNGRATTSVRGDGTWIARNVVLSDEDHGGRNFRFPGRYSIAVVDAADLESPPQTTISPSEFNRLTTSRGTVTTNAPSFVANFGGYAGQVAQGDRVSLTGVSTGPQEIVVGFVGDRDVRAETVRTTRGNTIDTNVDLGDMRRGEVTAFALSPGRDGVFGQGTATDADGNSVSIRTPTEFRDFVRSFDRDGRTRAQKMSRIRDASVERSGSDDLIRTSNIRIADARSTVRDIVPGEMPHLTGVVPVETGETLLIRGTTNRNPLDASIDVEITEGPDAAEFDVRTIDDWSASGRWETSFSTEGVEPGSYTVRIDDGRSTDTRSFSVVEEREVEPDDVAALRERLDELRDEIAFAEERNNELRDRLAELEEERDRLEQELNETEADDELPDEEEEQPGFTALAALVALLALVVLRRR